MRILVVDSCICGAARSWHPPEGFSNNHSNNIKCNHSRGRRLAPDRIRKNRHRSRGRSLTPDRVRSRSRSSSSSRSHGGSRSRSQESRKGDATAEWALYNAAWAAPLCESNRGFQAPTLTANPPPLILRLYTLANRVLSASSVCDACLPRFTHCQRRCYCVWDGIMVKGLEHTPTVASYLLPNPSHCKHIVVESEQETMLKRCTIPALNAPPHHNTAIAKRRNGRRGLSVPAHHNTATARRRRRTLANQPNHSTQQALPDPSRRSTAIAIRSLSALGADTFSPRRNTAIESRSLTALGSPPRRSIAIANKKQQALNDPPHQSTATVRRGQQELITTARRRTAIASRR